MDKVLITGGTGLVGTHLTALLLQEGWSVGVLSRYPEKSKGAAKAYQWNLDTGYIDPKAFEETKAIIHLAGADVAGKKWTSAYKQEIKSSRTQSAQILHNWLSENEHSVDTFLSASGVNYYPQNTGRRLIETDAPGEDFLAGVTKAWEKSADEIGKIGLRTTIFRIGIVLSNKGGALVELVRPVKWGAAAPLGSGSQVMSWIHIDDLCRMFLFALNNKSIRGVFNAVAPYPATNKDFVHTIAKRLHKPTIFPAVPAFALKLVLGERATIVLEGADVSSEKMQAAGFSFKYPKLEEAIRSLL